MKPKNILLSNSKTQLKIGDFGLAAEATTSVSSSVGTLGFRAPEVIAGGEYNTKVFSLR